MGLKLFNSEFKLTSSIKKRKGLNKSRPVTKNDWQDKSQMKEYFSKVRIAPDSLVRQEYFCQPGFSRGQKLLQQSAGVSRGRSNRAKKEMSKSWRKGKQPSNFSARKEKPSFKKSKITSLAQFLKRSPGKSKESAIKMTNPNFRITSRTNKYKNSSIEKQLSKYLKISTISSKLKAVNQPKDKKTFQSKLNLPNLSNTNRGDTRGNQCLTRKGLVSYGFLEREDVKGRIKSSVNKFKILSNKSFKDLNQGNKSQYRRKRPSKISSSQCIYCFQMNRL